MQVYADNAATTRMSDKALAAMTPYFQDIYGNPSSLHTVGQRAAEALADARRRVADCLGCSFREITFTSGGSEADNQAIISAARIGERKGKKHIISTAFEHHAILHTLKKLEKEGFEGELLDSDSAWQLHRLLHDLNEPYKEVFSLRVFGELSFSQIGQLFGKSDSWARLIFYRAKTELRRQADENDL